MRRVRVDYKVRYGRDRREALVGSIVPSVQVVQFCTLRVRNVKQVWASLTETMGRG